jgi:SWI/SNF-related matrix-associated actin-dependent regulator 1 of chromatin subfamily A
MGVGKTIQAISLAYLYKKDWPLMVICPSFLRLIWRDEILNWIKTHKKIINSNFM